MAQRKIVWTKTADLQFIGILEFWLQNNKSNSYPKKLIKLVTQRTKQIAENPFLYKKTDFKNIRVASLGNFSIYYKITQKQVIISAFWDNRQNPDKLISILQNKK